MGFEVNIFCKTILGTTCVTEKYSLETIFVEQLWSTLRFRLVMVVH